MDLVDRLYAKLREAARRELPSALEGEPVTVAEIYQRLIPYRAVRDELGLMELAQYEHVLLRLLSGERGHLRVEVAGAREDLQRELASPNPILGVYRDYAAVPVHLAADAPAGASPPEEVPPPSAAPAPAPPPAPRPAVVAQPEPARPPAACHHCREPLPDEEDVRFCPACGTNQREAPCAECGVLLRSGWNFCIRCGAPRGGYRSGA